MSIVAQCYSEYAARGVVNKLLRYAVRERTYSVVREHILYYVVNKLLRYARTRQPDLCVYCVCMNTRSIVCV